MILGTRAVQDREFLKKAFAKFGPKIIVSVDAAGGKIMVKGWIDSQCGLDALDFAGSLKKIGFNEMIYTDTLRDGTLKGPNFTAIKRLLGGSGLKPDRFRGDIVIARYPRSGGIGIQGCKRYYYR